jgi:hypothetical protein
LLHLLLCSSPCRRRLLVASVVLKLLEGIRGQARSAVIHRPLQYLPWRIRFQSNSSPCLRERRARTPLHVRCSVRRAPTCVPRQSPYKSTVRAPHRHFDAVGLARIA